MLGTLTAQDLGVEGRNRPYIFETAVTAGMVVVRN